MIFVEWAKLSNDILQITCLFLSKIISGLERPEPIPSENREGEENTSDFNDNDSNPSGVSADRSRNLDDEPSNSDDIKAWYTGNEHLFSVLRLITTGAARSVLLNLNQEIMANQEMVERLTCVKKQVSEHYSPA